MLTTPSVPVSPHLKALFQGFDVTIFAYGVTGTGKTHTMRGGLRLADRGLIPRLLSNVFRRGKKIAKDSNGQTTVQVALSYYEIYNDKVFDLLQTPDKRTPSGLPLREANGKTNVVGLSERACEEIKDFERMYIEANNNRVTAATKLNAHSSRSHAILRVKVTQTTGDTVLESTASAIDLAGSEDNRRTENNRERLVESAAINKSLFVLSQCVEAISRGEKRIPYRESKMTRILSLGQNNGITVMILNLAPMRSYHLDTLSSLNVSSRAKRIEVREIENEIVFKQAPRAMGLGGNGTQRQALRPLANVHNVHSGTLASNKDKAEADKDKPLKAFSVYADKTKSATARPASTSLASQPRKANAGKHRSDAHDVSQRPTKIVRSTGPTRPQPPHSSLTMSATQIEEMVERKVQEILAARVTAHTQDQEQQNTPAPQPAASAEISEAVQRRLEALERRIDDNVGEIGGRSEGMRLLLQARRLKEEGDDRAALRCYESALVYFPGQAKLMGKIEKLKAKLGHAPAAPKQAQPGKNTADGEATARAKASKHSAYAQDDGANDSDFNASEADADESFVGAARAKPKRKTQKTARPVLPTPESSFDSKLGSPTTRTRKLLDIVNSRDVDIIKGLHGFGPKKARDIVASLEGHETGSIESLEQLSTVPGFGPKTLQRAWEGIAC